VLEVEVGVDLRRGDARVPEHLLHRAQVARGLQHVRGERVAQHVRMHVDVEARGRRPVLDAALHLAGRDAPPRAAEEERLLAGPRATLAFRKPCLERRERGPSHRHDPRLGALAGDAHLARSRIDRVEVEAGELRNPQPARIGKLEDGAVAATRIRRTLAGD
jgi:hypothetical protein